MQPSRLVVLAAGVGSRLESKVGAKPLVRVGGMTLLERSIVAAHEAGFDDVVVVTGHEHEPCRSGGPRREPSPRAARCRRPQRALSGGQRTLRPRRERRRWRRTCGY
jgi:CTP:molybdopterin cytidylyltransferase MocA